MSAVGQVSPGGAAHGLAKDRQILTKLMHFDHALRCFLWLFYHAMLSNRLQLTDYNGLNIVFEGLRHATIGAS